MTSQNQRIDWHDNNKEPLEVPGVEVEPGQGRGGGGLEPVLAGVVRALGLHHVEGVGVPRLGACVPLGLVVHLHSAGYK